MTDGTWMGKMPSSELDGPSRALLFIISVSRWGPWWADPTNAYPHIPLPRAGRAGRMDPARWGPGAAALIVIIGICLMAAGEAPVIICAPILVVVAIIGVVIFALRLRPTKHHRWEKPPPHHLKHHGRHP